MPHAQSRVPLPTPADIDFPVTATAGFDSSGAGDGDGADEGLDDTGGDPVLAQDECLFNDDPPRHGYKYQCVGQFSIEIAVNDFDPEFLSVNFGQADSPDSYEDPHVMACCPPIGSPPCENPHLQACTIDMIEQGCKSLVARLEEFANDRPLFREPLLETANWIARSSSQQACLQTFLFDTAVATTEPSCNDESNSVFDFTAALEGVTWTFDPDTTNIIDRVELTILNPEIWDAKSPIDPPETCISSGDNDHLSFLETDPTIGDFKANLSEGTLALAGLTSDGAHLDSQALLSSAATSCVAPRCSHATWSLGGSDGELNAMSLFSHQPVQLETPMGILTLDSFQFNLFAPARGMVSGNALTIAAGEALFIASGQALGEQRWITVSNATPIQVHATQGGWSIEGFTIDYQDAAGDILEVTLPSSTWD